MKYKIYTLVGENCITLDDGQKVYDQIFPELKIGHEVELDFTGANVFASPFFNSAIGRLLKDFTPEDLNLLLKVENLAPPGMAVLRRVIENSKRYYRDYAERKRRALGDILREQAEHV